MTTPEHPAATGDASHYSLDDEYQDRVAYERTRPVYKRPLWIKVEMLRERLAILIAPWAVYEDLRRLHDGR